MPNKIYILGPTGWATAVQKLLNPLMSRQIEHVNSHPTPEAIHWLRTLRDAIIVVPSLEYYDALFPNCNHMIDKNRIRIMLMGILV